MSIKEAPSEAYSSSFRKPSKLSVGSMASHGTKEDLSPLDELSALATQARTEMVQKVLEGLREEAFELDPVGCVTLSTNRLRDIALPVP